MTAVNMYGQSILTAAENLKGDREIAKIAVSNNPFAIVIAPETPRKAGVLFGISSSLLMLCSGVGSFIAVYFAGFVIFFTCYPWTLVKKIFLLPILWAITPLAGKIDFHHKIITSRRPAWPRQFPTRSAAPAMLQPGQTCRMTPQ